MASDKAPSGLRTNRNWQRLFLGQAVSVLGDFIFDITVVLWVGTVIAKGYSWAPTAVGGVLIAAGLPIFLIGPIAGVYVDRWDRKQTMLVADGLRGVIVAALLIVPALGDRIPVGLQLTIVYLGVGICSAASVFFNPARMKIVRSTVPKEDRSRAYGLSQATANTAGLLGPPLAAPLLFGVGLQWALVFNALSFAFSYVMIRSVRVEPDETSTVPATGDAPPSFAAEFREGIRFVALNRTLRAMLISTCIYTLGVGALDVLNVFFVTNNLHRAATWLGTLSGALAAGSILGALITAKYAVRIGERRIYWLGTAVTGVVTLVYSRMTNLVAAVVVIALAGIAVAAINVVIGPLLTEVTPERLMGRVVTVIGPIQRLASIVAMAVAGYLASTAFRGLNFHAVGMHFGPIDTIFAVSALLMIFAGLWVSGQLGSAEEPSDAASAGPALPLPPISADLAGVDMAADVIATEIETDAATVADAITSEAR